MKQYAFRHLFNIGVVVLMAAVVLTAMGFNRQSALLPLLVGVPTLFLAIANMIVDFREYGASKRETAARESQSMQAGEERQSKFRKEVSVSLWVLGLFISLYLFGFIATTFFYTLLSLKVRSHFGWKVSLGISIGSLAFLYLLLIYILEVDLYQGAVIIAVRKAVLGY